jgi:acetoin utilization deacetylase AcuC-like enzyme
MKKTGIFYHRVCGEKAYKILAMSVEEGFAVLEKEGLFLEPNIILFESQPVSEEMILEIHTTDLLERVKRSGYYETSLYSIGGTVQATEKVLKEEIDNALVFIGVGGHHASRNNYWGGCFFNPMAIAITKARKDQGLRRVAIVDTDTHHADGTREIFQDDEDILHICFCGGYFWGYNSSNRRDSKTKVCLSHASSDEEFIERLKEEVPYRVEEFKPELIYWVCGLDTHRDSYGTGCLSERCYPKLAEIIKETAEQACQGKLIVKTGCNAPAYVSEYVNPRIIDCLAELKRYPQER